MSDTIKSLIETVRGRVIIASDPHYDDVRAVYDAMHDRRPGPIVQCTDSADVIAVIAAARDRGVDLAIRGGGPQRSRIGAMDDGLVIDLSPMEGRTCRPAKRSPGSGAARRAPGGIVSTTGVAGSRLDGSIGYLTGSVSSPSTTRSRPMSFLPMAGRSRTSATADVAEVKAELVEVMPFPSLQSAFDDFVPRGICSATTRTVPPRATAPTTSGSPP